MYSRFFQIKRLILHNTDSSSYFCIENSPGACPGKTERAMSRLGTILLLCAALAACTKVGSGMDVTPVEIPDAEPAMIVLGEKLDNPYTTENMRDAYASLYPTRSRYDVETSHLYVRFLPADEDELEQLTSAGLDLVDYPLDYEILVDGDYYQDPSVGENITWQYAVVPAEYEFPDNIRHEILDECFITETDPDTRFAGGADWAAVEAEAYRISGNGNMLDAGTRGGKVNPTGRITIVDDEANGGKPVGLAGVRIRCNTFVKFSNTFTDRDGYYTIPRTFSAKLKYRLVFKNEKGFAIGFNLILQPASASSLGKGPASGINATITRNSDRTLFLRSAVNNAAYEYITRCGNEDMNLTLPPGDLRIWLMSKLDASSAVLLHHKVGVSHELVKDFLGYFASLISFFAPDVTIGTKNMDSYSDVYRAVCHELAHCSHFSQVGLDYWNRYVEYILRSYVSTGGMTYGEGSGDYAGYCEVGEMWAYYLESVMYQDRYGGPMPQFGTSYWFSPQIFRYLDERGMERSDFLDAMQPDVTSLPALQSKMISLYPSRAMTIEQVFFRYK